ncbi:bifunctional hydroxymethylpyrimidine kinase/phosphomethylpyrimidine kinase [Thioclava sp. 'Guangxiensis']|uniref:bifunctional hydroxymethylpyrimidine kinase/phosphomethylpyrimidine kinase n=1 Tax=Thioclava sp. 'Guangxiensis' TaxID=3149044 RepID=UPI0038780329
MVARLLIIAGSDSGGGAGLQADMKAASALGVYAMTAVTAVTAQNTRGVSAVALMTPEMLRAQIRACLEDIGADAVKIGMLGSADLVRVVAEELAGFAGPVVLDPVMIAKSGDALLAEEAVAALTTQLLPRATLLTPNLPEAACLLGLPEAQEADEAQARALQALGPGAVLLKGGHAAGEVCTDLLLADAAYRFTAPRIATRNTHGTGCSLASAVAAGLASGRPLPEAVARAHDWLQGAIRAADSLQIGQGHGPVHHFHGIWSEEALV